MNPRRQKRLAFLVVVLLLLSGSVGFILYALKQNIDLFYTPGEITQEIKSSEKKSVTIGQRLRIGGLVVKNSVQRDPDTLQVQFDLTDTSGAIVTVFYNGILPDLFREGQGIIAQGKLIAARKVQASEVLAKHDENYMPPQLAKSMEAHMEKINQLEGQ